MTDLISRALLRNFRCDFSQVLPFARRSVRAFQSLPRASMVSFGTRITRLRSEVNRLAAPEPSELLVASSASVSSRVLVGFILKAHLPQSQLYHQLTGCPISELATLPLEVPLQWHLRALRTFGRHT
jgi:hypothetical protein